MESISNYLLSIITVVILCGILTSITEKSTYSKVLRLITGIIIMLSVFKPMSVSSIGRLDFSQMLFRDEAASIISKGQEVANEQLDAVIRDRVCAYIEDRADIYGAEITASVALSQHIPSEITLHGEIAPYAKRQLAAWISEELGIPKEAQNWK